MGNSTMNDHFRWPCEIARWYILGLLNSVLNMGYGLPMGFIPQQHGNINGRWRLKNMYIWDMTMEEQCHDYHPNFRWLESHPFIYGDEWGIGANGIAIPTF